MTTFKSETPEGSNPAETAAIGKTPELHATQRMNDLLALSHVPRWSIVRHTRPQSVADHSFRVAIILIELANLLNVPLTLRALMYALIHDGPESRSGDIPTAFKHELGSTVMGETEDDVCPWYKTAVYWTIATSFELLQLVKLADLIEAYTFIVSNGIGHHAHEVALGCLSKVTHYRLSEMKLTDEQNHKIVRLISDIIQETGRGQSDHAPYQGSLDQ